MTSILIIGSGPNALQAQFWDRTNFDRIVVINNAWRVRPDWDYLIFPNDFPSDRQPDIISGTQKFVTSNNYVPHQNAYGGFVYAGGTMAFTAAYWALSSLKPSVIAMIGCDMEYPATGPTHFYGTGTADPLRNDISLRSLPAKSARLMALAARDNCAVLNLSHDPSVLTFPRAHPTYAAAHKPVQHNATAVAAALQKERDLGYYVPSGKYWKEEARFDPTEIDDLDAMWLALVPPAQ
ncbi:MAG: hypothetical protein ACJAXK_000228 [Yoonia sp.]|jgi:hypothetical protein